MPSPARSTVRLGLVTLLLLAGCSSQRPPAPIVEAPRFPPAPAGMVRVQPGDTLFKIAFERGLDYRALAEWNRLADPNRIQAGQLLRLTPPPRPAPQTTTPAPSRPAEPRPAASPGPATPPAPRPATPPATAPVGDDPADGEAPPAAWTWPARGTLIARFNVAAGSKGIDIAGEAGSPVLASADGRVVYAGSGLRGYGKLIIIKEALNK